MKTPFANIGERRAVPSNAPSRRAVDFRRFDRSDYFVCAGRAEYPEIFETVPTSLDAVARTSPLVKHHSNIDAFRLAAKRVVLNVDASILPRLETFNKIRPRKNRGKERKKEKFLRQTLETARRRRRPSGSPAPDAQESCVKAGITARFPI